MTRYLQLVLACVVLGTGVAFLLEARLGSDGYSSLVNGLRIVTGQPFWLLNLVVGAVFIAMAWLRGMRPGVGTLVSWFVVGSVISVAMTAIPPVGGLPLRVGSLALAFVLMSVGVAGYLASRTGAGPAEAAALAWDPPIPFKWSYSMVQGGGALLGWLLGSAVGPGTLLVIVLLGPAVDVLRRRLPMMERR